MCLNIAKPTLVINAAEAGTNPYTDLIMCENTNNVQMGQKNQDYCQNAMLN